MVSKAQFLVAERCNCLVSLFSFEWRVHTEINEIMTAIIL